MLPTVNRSRPSAGYRSNSVLPQYLRRIIKYQQMDLEYTFWQMLHLCTSPKVVYQHTKYHKQTKNQWARDDPAFVVVCSFLLAVAASAFCAALVFVPVLQLLLSNFFWLLLILLAVDLTHYVFIVLCQSLMWCVCDMWSFFCRYGDNVAKALLIVVSVVCVHFLLVGISLATICWFLSNHYLREEMAVHTHVVEQRVEWLYAFDIHCNSYFPVFVVLYVLQYFLSPLLLSHGFVATLMSNALFVIAFSYYHYLNFLGYDVLPFLERTTFFLYPIGLLVILFPISVLAGFNPTRFTLSFYFG